MRRIIDDKSLGFPVLLLMMFMMLSGITKFASTDLQQQLFSYLGLSPWMMYAVGALEIIGAVLLASSDTRDRGVLLLGGVMFGASTLHLMQGDVSLALLPMTLLSLLAMIAWGTRDELFSALRRLPQVVF
ncbi:MAG: DoxX family protein [Myxococcota bacterium]|nr:DoxX family protein [Myxococcota bacterium]